MKDISVLFFLNAIIDKMQPAECQKKASQFKTERPFSLSRLGNINQSSNENDKTPDSANE